MNKRFDLFEKVLSSPREEIVFELRGHDSLGWADFLLNPRRLRGSDFLMRWSQGKWSEERLLQMLNETADYFGIPYGPSGTAPDDPREFELYFIRLEQAGLADIKRPDILVFRKDDEPLVRKTVEDLGGLAELPFTPDDDKRMETILSRAVVAVESENSLWRAKKMPDYGVLLKPQKRLKGKLGLRKAAVLPTVIVKEEDRAPLRGWQKHHGIPIHVWHVFYDMAYGISLAVIENLIKNGEIEPTQQTFQAPSGPTTTKVIYKVYYHYAYPLGDAHQEPTLVADFIDDKNGHILPYVRFNGGSLRIRAEALEVLYTLSERP